jgi:hypothetical protein
MNIGANSVVSQRYSKRINITLVTLLLVVSSGVVWADSPHYKKPPSCVDNGFTATCTGSVSGLGNGDVIVTAAFPDATGTTTCTNKGGNQAPGQNPAADAATSGTQFINDPKNGTLSFAVTTDVPTNPTSAEAGCPSGQWTAAFNNITFGCGTLTVKQETFQGSGVFVTVLTTDVCI